MQPERTHPSDAFFHTKEGSVDNGWKRSFDQVRGGHCTTNRRLNLRALAIILALASQDRCEFTVDSYRAVLELIESGALKWSDSPDHIHGTIHFAGERYPLSLTPLGFGLALAVLQKLDDSGMVNTPEALIGRR